jgi:hypothetical protein
MRWMVAGSAALLAAACGAHAAPSAPSATMLNLTVSLTVSNVKFGTAVPSDFAVSVSGPSTNLTVGVADEGPALIAVAAGAPYTVTVAGPAGYTPTASTDCAGVAVVGRKSCAIELKEAALTCDDTLWNRIYLRDRLRLLSQCQAASGVVADLGIEPDGDLVMEMIPDRAYTSLLRSGNSTPDAHGHLVVEVPCQGPTSQTSPSAACAQFTGTKVAVPSLGAHIAVAAPWVEDLNHSAWGELHGARLVLLPR